MTQPVIEHRDGSCGTAFLLEMAGAVVEGAEIAQPLQPPSGVVAGNEVADRCPDLGGGAEGFAPNRLFLEGPKEPLDDAVALWLVREGVAQRDAPVADLVREVVGRVLRPIVQAQRHAAGGIGHDPAEPGCHRLADRLERREVRTVGRNMMPNDLGVDGFNGLVSYFNQMP